MAYAKRYGAGFVDKPTLTTPIDSQFLNAVEAALLALFDANPGAAGMVPVWTPAGTHYVPQLLTNASIDPAAAIAKSKLAALNILDADVAGGAAIARSKLNFGAGLVPDSDFAKLASWSGTIASAATLPNVAGRFQVYGVTGTTTVTNFTVGGIAGDLLTIYASGQAAGVCVVISHAGVVKLRDTANLGLYAGESLTFAWDGAAWNEIARNLKTVLSYTEQTGTVSSTTATEAAPLDVVVAPSTTFDGATPILAELFCPTMITGGTANSGISLWEDANDKGRMYDDSGQAIVAMYSMFRRRYTPSAAAHVLKARLWTNGGNNLQLAAGAGGVATRLPAYLRISRDL